MRSNEFVTIHRFLGQLVWSCTQCKGRNAVNDLACNFCDAERGAIRRDVVALRCIKFVGVEQQCPICLESISTGSRIAVIQCGHVGCYSCMLNLVCRGSSLEAKCPKCRRLLDVMVVEEYTIDTDSNVE